MKELDLKSKNLLKVVVVGILLYFGLYYIGHVAGALGKLYLVIQPFILGGALAFVISIPMNFFEVEFAHLDPTGKHKKLISTCSLLLSWILVITSLVVLVNILVPSIIKIVYTFSIRWPDFVDEIYRLLKKYPFTEPFANKFQNTFYGVGWYNVRNAVYNFLQDKDGDVFSTATKLMSSVSSGVIGVLSLIHISEPTRRPG